MGTVGKYSYSNRTKSIKAPPVKPTRWDEPSIRSYNYPPTEHDGSLKLKLKRRGRGLNYDIFVLSEGGDHPYFMVRENG